MSGQEYTLISSDGGVVGHTATIDLLRQRDLKQGSSELVFPAATTERARKDADKIVDDVHSSWTGNTSEKLLLVQKPSNPDSTRLTHPIRTCLALGICFHLNYAAFNGLQNIQSSINSSQALGVISMSVIYLLAVSTAPLATTILRIGGYKQQMLISWLARAFYVAANFFPSFFTLIPASVFVGATTGYIGMINFMYTTAIGDSYVAQKSMGPERRHGVLSVVNGVFYTIWELTQVTGNLLSSTFLYLLSQTPHRKDAENTYGCGAAKCPASGQNFTAIAQPDDSTIYILLSVYLACIALGCLVGWVFLPPLVVPRLSTTLPALHEVKECFKTFLDVRCAPVIPLFMSQAMMIMILYTGFTDAYISCVLGVEWVGFIMMAYGTSAATFSILANCLARYVGRIVLIVTFILTDLSILVTLLMWTPGQQHTKAVLFSIASAAGVSEGIARPQLTVFLNVVLKEKQAAAYAVFTMVQLLSYAVTPLLSAFICMNHRLYLAMAMYTLGFTGYVTTEVVMYKETFYK